jgi:hypothetical protein
MKNLKLVGVLFGIAGVALIVVGGLVVYKAQKGKESLQAVYRAQNVIMSYDEDGNFVDRGTIESGDAILKLLIEDWKYPLNRKNLDPNDPLVNTADELMVTYARINYHVIHGTQTIVLDEDVEYEGEIYEAGSHEFDVEGRYWQGFDRNHPLEGPARDLAWTGTAHSLLANLAAGTVSDSLVQFVWFVGILAIGLGATFILGGIGLILASRKEIMTA